MRPLYPATQKNKEKNEKKKKAYVNLMENKIEFITMNTMIFIQLKYMEVFHQRRVEECLESQMAFSLLLLNAIR